MVYRICRFCKVCAISFGSVFFRLVDTIVVIIDIIIGSGRIIVVIVIHIDILILISIAGVIIIIIPKFFLICVFFGAGIADKL